MKAKPFGSPGPIKELVRSKEGKYEVHLVNGIHHYVKHSIGLAPLNNRWMEVGGDEEAEERPARQDRD